jgi:hypothetical protein
MAINKMQAANDVELDSVVFQVSSADNRWTLVWDALAAFMITVVSQKFLLWPLFDIYNNQTF